MIESKLELYRLSPYSLIYLCGEAPPCLLTDGVQIHIRTRHMSGFGFSSSSRLYVTPLSLEHKIGLALLEKGESRDNGTITVYKKNFPYDVGTDNLKKGSELCEATGLSAKELIQRRYIIQKQRERDGHVYWQTNLSSIPKDLRNFFFAQPSSSFNVITSSVEQKLKEKGTIAEDYLRLAEFAQDRFGFRCEPEKFHVIRTAYCGNYDKEKFPVDILAAEANGQPWYVNGISKSRFSEKDELFCEKLNRLSEIRNWKTNFLENFDESGSLRPRAIVYLGKGKGFLVDPQKDLFCVTSGEVQRKFFVRAIGKSQYFSELDGCLTAVDYFASRQLAQGENGNHRSLAVAAGSGGLRESLTRTSFGQDASRPVPGAPIPLLSADFYF